MSAVDFHAFKLKNRMVLCFCVAHDHRYDRKSHLVLNKCHFLLSSLVQDLYQVIVKNHLKLFYAYS